MLFRGAFIGSGGTRHGRYSTLRVLGLRTRRLYQSPSMCRVRNFKLQAFRKRYDGSRIYSPEEIFLLVLLSPVLLLSSFEIQRYRDFGGLLKGDLLNHLSNGSNTNFFIMHFPRWISGRLSTWKYNR